METTTAHPETVASGNVYSADVLLRMIVALLAPMVAKELRTKVKEDDTADLWLDQVASPLGRQAHCRACASGAIRGARKVGRRWLVRRSDLDAFIVARGKSADVPPAASGVLKVDDDDEPSDADITRELAAAGLAYTARRGAR